MSEKFFEEGKRKYTLFHVRPYKVKELAALYHINLRTFQRWLYRIRTKLGKIEGQYLMIEQVEIIISHYKMPYFIQVEVVSEDEAENNGSKKRSA